MDFDLRLALRFISAAALFALAWLLLAVKFSSRVNRSFAFVSFLLGLNALVVGLEYVAETAGADRWATYWLVMQTHVLLALGPVLLYFLICYLQVGRGTLDWALRGGLWLVGVAIQLAYAADHCLDFCPIEAPQWAGPLSLLPSGLPLFMALVGLTLVHTTKKMPRARIRGTLLLGSALVLYSLFDGAFFWSRVLFGPPAEFFASYPKSSWMVANNVILGVALVAAIASVIYADTRWSFLRGQFAAGLPAAAGAAVASGLVSAWFFRAPLWGESGPEQLVIGAWRIVLPAVAVYALARHRLFGVELGLKKGITRGTIVAVFLGVFLASSKIIEFYFDHTLGFLVGGIAAGITVLVIHPLEHLGERIAELVLPHARAIKGYDKQERRAFYEEMATLVWQDGTMDRKERAILDQLRQRLGVPPEEAVKLEVAASMAKERTAV